MNAKVYVRFNPTLFPGSGALIIKRYAIPSRITSSVEKETPGVGVIVFPALCNYPAMP